FAKLAVLHRCETVDELLRELRFSRANASTEFVIKLDRQIDDALRRQVCRNVNLAAAHDAHVDDALPRLWVRSRVCRGPAIVFKLGKQLGPGLFGVGPAEEAPDRAEVVDLVDERRTGQSDEERLRPSA